MASNYTYRKSANGQFHILRTHASNIKPIIIGQPLCSTSHYGMNGGVFESSDYSKPPKWGLGISWHKGQTSGVVDKNAGGTGKPRLTLVTYFDTKANQTRATFYSAENISQIRSALGNLDYRTMIGGGTLSLYHDENTWKKVHFPQEGWRDWYITGVAARSGIGAKVENGQTFIYMVVSNVKEYPTASRFHTLTDLRNIFVGLGCDNAIWLDGSGSAQMQANVNGSLINEYGTDGKPGRYIHNAVTLINKN